MDTGALERHELEAPSALPRVALFDVVRGFSVVSMVLFHLAYDLKFIYGCPLAFFAPPLQDVWRASISWTFLFIAGCMCSFSRNGLARALRYLGVALSVYIATSIAAVDTPISFGIIFCMGASTLVAWGLERLGMKPRSLQAAVALFCAFIALRGVPHGYVGLGHLHITLPNACYATPFLAWLGLPGPHFASGDYYPLLPYTLMYLTGSAVGRMLSLRGYPRCFYDLANPPLQWIGRHALLIYVVHQPLMLAVLELVLR